MGRDWLHRGGGGSSSRSTKSARSGGVEREAPAGCMCSVFQLFDFHQFQSAALHQQVPSFKPPSLHTGKPNILQGVEAPRNSLEEEEEEEEPFIEAPASFPSTIKEEETLNIPMGIQIKTSGGHPKARREINDLSSSEYSSSPVAAKTPNLVARLMGLDLLPDISSPSSSSNHPQLQYLKQELKSRQFIRGQSSSSRGRNYLDTDIIGTRSLPETPRLSSARRSDVADHRLSLQINKENIGLSQDHLEFSILKAARRREIGQENEIKSPGHYARQIVKQVKESVGRKVGLDITNTVIRNREQQRDDDQIVLLKSKKPSKGLSKVGDELKKNKPVILSQSPLSSSVEIHSQSARISSTPNQEFKKIASERYTPRLKRPPQTSDVIKNKQEEPFVRSSSTNRPNVSEKKCKKTPVSSGLLNINVPTLFPVRKDPPVTTANSSQKQSKVSDALNLSKKSTQLSSCSSQKYNKQEATQKLSLQEKNSSNSTTAGGGAEFQYIAGILKRTGIETNTTVSFFTKWHSPFHPVNPSIFHHLEHSLSSTAAANNSQLRHRWNRKLIFQLVDEILAEILKPYMDLKPWVSPVLVHGNQIYGSQLLERLCSRIRSFPSADCQVLEDIDGLIGRDLRRSQLQGLVALEEEGESIVAEIEGDIVDTLVREMAVALF